MSSLLAIWLDEDGTGGGPGLAHFLATARALLPAGEAGLEALALGSTALTAPVPDGVLVRQLLHPGLALPIQSEQALTLLERALQARAGLPTALVLPATALGRELCARLAARLGGQALGVCVGLQPDPEGGERWLATRSLWGGRVQVQLRAKAPLLLCVQAAPAAEGQAGAAGAIEVEERRDLLPAADHVSHEKPAERRRPVEQARIVVSGGRGMAGPEGFAQLEAIAGRLEGAAVGGSLPTVDAGWVPVSHQVGQSGTYVSPSIYLAVAISGTPQHLAGIAPHTRIVAINKDPAADIFRRARVGVVAEWQTFLPLLAASLAGTVDNNDPVKVIATLPPV